MKKHGSIGGHTEKSATQIEALQVEGNAVDGRRDSIMSQEN